MSFSILGAGQALPEFVLSNKKLTTMVDVTEEWIVSRTGIENRFICTKETLLDLALAAGQQALQASNTRAQDLDLIICTTMGSDYFTPSLACMVQKMLGAACPALDINAACTGFLYGLDLASAYFDSNKAKKILLISAEVMSNYVDWTDRATCILFGDGAGAVVLEKGNNLLAMHLTASGNDEVLVVGGAKGNNPFLTRKPFNEFLEMNGQEVFKFAVQAMCKDIALVLAEAGLTLGDIQKIIPHQANLRILKAAQERLKIADDQMVSGMARYGNTSSASIPILLADLLKSGELIQGDTIVLSAFGGGLTTGACIIKL